MGVYFNYSKGNEIPKEKEIKNMSKKEFEIELVKHGLPLRVVEDFTEQLIFEGRVKPFDYENYISKEDAEKIFKSL